MAAGYYASRSHSRRRHHDVHKHMTRTNQHSPSAATTRSNHGQTTAKSHIAIAAAVPSMQHHPALMHNACRACKRTPVAPLTAPYQSHINQPIVLMYFLRDALHLILLSVSTSNETPGWPGIQPRCQAHCPQHTARAMRHRRRPAMA